MRLNVRQIRRGFTLIELSVAIMMGLATGTMVLALFNQQLAFLSLYKSQSFLTEEAPIISMYVSRLVGKADRFRIHRNLEDARSGESPMTEAETLNPADPARAVVLNFRQPDGTMRATILAFEDIGGGPALHYYVVPVVGVLQAPNWAVTKAPSDVTFSMDKGVLRMTLTGPNEERITYSGTMQQ